MKNILALLLVLTLLLSGIPTLALADEAAHSIVGYWKCIALDGTPPSNFGVDFYFDFEANNNWCISNQYEGSSPNTTYGTWRLENNKYYIDYYDNAGYAHADLSVTWIDGETLELKVLTIQNASSSALMQGCLYRLKRIEMPYGNAREDLSLQDYVGVWEYIATYSGGSPNGYQNGSSTITFESNGEIVHSSSWISFDWSNAEFTDGKLIICAEEPFGPNSSSTWSCFINDENQLVCNVTDTFLNEWTNEYFTSFSTEVYNFLW